MNEDENDFGKFMSKLKELQEKPETSGVKIKLHSNVFSISTPHICNELIAASTPVLKNFADFLNGNFDNTQAILDVMQLCARLEFFSLVQEELQPGSAKTGRKSLSKLLNSVKLM